MNIKLCFSIFMLLLLFIGCSKQMEFTELNTDELLVPESDCDIDDNLCLTSDNRLVAFWAENTLDQSNKSILNRSELIDQLSLRSDKIGKLLQLPEDPVALYSFSGNAEDESINSNHGTAIGACLTYDRDGNYNSAYRFDGVDDYIDIGNDLSLKPFFPMTISCWINVHVATCQVIFTNNFDHDYYYGIWLGISQAGFPAISYGNGGDISSLSRRTKPVLPS